MEIGEYHGLSCGCEYTRWLAEGGGGKVEWHRTCKYWVGIEGRTQVKHCDRYYLDKRSYIYGLCDCGIHRKQTIRRRIKGFFGYKEANYMKYLIILLLLAGCGDVGDARHTQDINTFRQRNAERVIRNLVYIKDPKTNICFAYYDSGAAGTGLLTTVPCEK